MISPQEQAVRSQLQQSREKLQRLTQELRAVDGELEGLSTQRPQFELLEQACSSLEKLGDLGVAALFWGEREDDRAAERLLQARQRVDAFQGELRDLDGRRQDLLWSIEQQEEWLDVLYDELYQTEQQEERRKQEWIVEREVDPLPQRAQVMAWSRGGEEDQRFRKALAGAVLACLLLAALIPMTDLPLPYLDRRIEVPDRLVQLIREERARPVPPLPAPEKPPEEPKPQEQREEPKPQEQQRQDRPLPPEQPALASAQPQEAAKQAGILAFRERFSSLAQDSVAPRLGVQARISSSDDASVGRTERSMLTTNAPGSSGGINLAALSRDVGGGGGGMAGVQVTRATSAIGGIGAPGANRPLSGDSHGMSRTDEEIQIVFDRYKAALYRLYNRELRKDPTLRGQMVLRLTIEPDGGVSLCEMQASDMNAPELSAQVVERVRTINFGAKEGITAITILYPIDFLPAA